jgi:hypothetical protein
VTNAGKVFTLIDTTNLQENEIEEKNFTFGHLLFLAPFANGTESSSKSGKKIKLDEGMTVFDYFDDELMVQASQV